MADARSIKSMFRLPLPAYFAAAVCFLCGASYLYGETQDATGFGLMWGAVTVLLGVGILLRNRILAFAAMIVFVLHLVGGAFMGAVLLFTVLAPPDSSIDKPDSLTYPGVVVMVFTIVLISLLNGGALYALSRPSMRQWLERKPHLPSQETGNKGKEVDILAQFREHLN